MLAGIEQVKIFVGFEILDGDLHVQVLVPHLSHGSHICPGSITYALGSKNDGRQALRTTIFGLRQQLTRLDGIVRQALEIRVETGQGRRVETVGWNPNPVIHHINELLPVEGQAERLAHFGVIERRLAYIKGNVIGTHADAADQIGMQRIGRIEHARHICRRNSGHVDLARFEQVDADASIQLHHNLRNGRHTQVVIGIGVVHHQLKTVPAAQFVWPGAIGRAIPIRAGFNIFLIQHKGNRQG